MSEAAHGSQLVRRVVAEHRRVILPLVVLLVFNVLVYAGGVYPLAQRVANIQERDRAAEQALQHAQREHDAASGARAGKERAAVELATFYKDVLPADFPGARRLTYLRLNQLAREAGLRVTSLDTDPSNAERHSTLERVEIALDLEGSYDAIRAFIYQLDTAPEFVVIDDVSLSDREGDARVHGLSMRMSTFYSKAPAQ
jgi:Tfp pilus assembly protein PilO